MNIKEFYNLRDTGKIATKVIFLHDGETVVESTKFNGRFYIAEAHLDLHKETVDEELLHEFPTAEEANRYYIEEIKTLKGYIKREVRRQEHAYGDYIERFAGTLD